MGEKIVSLNRQARFLYDLIEFYEAGMMLKGTEVKSLRAGQVSLKDSYAMIRNGELFLLNLHIPPYEQGNRFNLPPTRTRKLLLHKNEIMKLMGKAQIKGCTLIPTRLYFKDGRAKVEIALAKGKKLFDKRRSIKEREEKRNLSKAMKVSLQERE